MADVNCRDCNKEITSAVGVCSWCGARQGSERDGTKPRNIGVLFVFGAGWSLIMWLVFIFLGGIIVGVIDGLVDITPKEFGRITGVPALFASIAISVLFTKWGLLPGTRKKRMSKSN